MMPHPLYFFSIDIFRLAALACVDGIAFADAAPAEGAEGKTSSMSFAFNSMIACLLFFIFLVGAAVDIPVCKQIGLVHSSIFRF